MLILTFIFMVLFAAPYPALAYLDPGSVSYFVQMLVAVLAGVGFAVKVFWQNIKSLFSKFFSRGKKNETDISGDK